MTGDFFSFAFTVRLTYFSRLFYPEIKKKQNKLSWTNMTLPELNSAFQKMWYEQLIHHLTQNGISFSHRGSIKQMNVIMILKKSTF